MAHLVVQFHEQRTAGNIQHLIVAIHNLIVHFPGQRFFDFGDVIIHFDFFLEVDHIVLNVVNADPVFGAFPEASEFIGQGSIVHIIKIETADMVFPAIVGILVCIH
ncbi:hypothetical protein D3C80_1712210 [compost metagenome]